MNTVTYSEINCLDEIFFIGGTTYTLKIDVEDKNGNPYNLTSASAICRVKVSPYGENYAMLDKAGDIVATNRFQVIFSSGDTQYLSGKFTYQPIITTGSVVLVPAQGVMIITKGVS